MVCLLRLVFIKSGVFIKSCVFIKSGVFIKIGVFIKSGGAPRNDTHQWPVDAHVWRQLHVSAVARCSDS